MKRIAERWRKRVCVGCGQRPARYMYGGRVRRRRDHDLCFACFRSLRDAFRGWLGGQAQGSRSQGW